MSDAGKPHDWREALFSRRTLGVRFGLDELRAVDAELGYPAAAARRVQVLGTNGKGSTASMLAHLLRASGRRVGLYTSPHLHRVGERVRIDGVPVSDEEVRVACERVLDAEGAAARTLSFFELITMAAWLIFEARGVEDVVLEAGLGGRLDATSMRPCATHLFTGVGFDHQAYLGDTLSEILEEKVAVFHADGTCFAAPLTEDLRAQVRARASESGERLIWIDEPEAGPLAGEAQRVNTALALAAARHLGVDVTREGPWEGFAWPGRGERVHLERGGEVVFDVAHNPQAIAALVRSVQTGQLPQPQVVVFGAMSDKAPGELAARLAELGAEMWSAPPAREGAAQAGAHVDWARSFEDAGSPSLHTAIDAVVSEGGCVLVCGSHFVVAPIRAHVLSISALDIDAPELTDPVFRG